MSNPQCHCWVSDPGLSKRAGWASLLLFLQGTSCLQVPVLSSCPGFSPWCTTMWKCSKYKPNKPFFFLHEVCCGQCFIIATETPTRTVQHISVCVKKTELSFPLSFWLGRRSECWTSRWLRVQSCIPALETSMGSGTQIIGFLSTVESKGSGQQFHFVRTGARRTWITQRWEGRSRLQV